MEPLILPFFLLTFPKFAPLLIPYQFIRIPMFSPFVYTHRKLILLALGLCLYISPVLGQKKIPKTQVDPSSLEAIRDAAQKKKLLKSQSILQNYPVRGIGPQVMGGRVVDIESSSKNPNVYYVAYASGGVFKTETQGMSFEPIFDEQERMTIGDMAVHPQNDQVIWVGTGENNSSRSSYAGFGVYKSSDGGKNWQHMGLENTQHIGRIALHPQNPQVAWVGSLGALYSSNSDRGVYKTQDGGQTWEKTLFINDSTGIVDLIVNPQNPDELWAAAWEKSRAAWSFKENGPGSGLYYSSDGGESWKKLQNGLPQAQHMGRIGLDICQSNPQVLYLVLDNQEEIKEEKKREENKPSLDFANFLEMSQADLLALSNQRLDSFLRDKNFPSKYRASLVKEEVKAGKYRPEAIARYFNDANDALFSTKIRGPEVYRSNDGGQSWKKVNTGDLEGIFYTYGYYFGQVRVDPSDADRIYIFGVRLIRSDDGGKTYQEIAEQNVHSDHHAMWIDPQNPQRNLLGNDGGVYVSYDFGENYWHLNNVSVGQFYTVNVDYQKPYFVYGGLQDNGVFRGSSQSVPGEGKKWERVFGGDGMYVAAHPDNPDLIYTGFQFGNYFRLDLKRRKRKRITPRHDIGEPPLRYNWRTPLIMSAHNPDILYIGAQKVYRSLDRGDSWQSISPDLSLNYSSKNVPFSTISTLQESKLRFGLLYAGTDDGKVFTSPDGGVTWQDISRGLPANRWVSSIFPSSLKEGTVYVSLNGYRYDEVDAFVFKSEDYGKTWTSIKANLPNEAVNVVIEDPKVPGLLYLGTDEGAYVRMPEAQDWIVLTGDFPNVPTYDLIVHPRDLELVLATHGRSMYALDVKPIQAIAQKKNPSGLYVFAPEKLRHSKSWGESSFTYTQANTPEVEIVYYTPPSQKKSPRLEILNAQGKVLRRMEGVSKPGFHRWTWDLKGKDGSYLAVGDYKIRFSGDQGEDLRPFTIYQAK